MTDLWDWADVAAVGYIVGLYVGATPANVLMGYVPGPRSQFAAAIRYGYEQAQRDHISELERLREAALKLCWEVGRYFPGENVDTIRRLAGELEKAAGE